MSGGSVVTDRKVPRSAAVFGRWLRSNTAVTALVGPRSSTKLQGSDAAIRYSLAATDHTANDWEHLPVFQVEAWAKGDDETQAEDIILTVVDELHTLVGQRGNTLVASADVTAGPWQADDVTTLRARWIIQVQLYVFDNPEGASA